MNLPLHGLKAFESAARHLSFARAGEELCVTAAAVSQQVRQLEDRLGVSLFRRLPRGLALTDEGHRLWPVVVGCFGELQAEMARLKEGAPQHVLTVGVVSSLAVLWLMPRLARFHARHPDIELRLLCHHNRVDLATEGWDAAIRFGLGAWHGTEVTPLLSTPLQPMTAPALASRLRAPSDWAGVTLLRSYRVDEWPRWFEQQGWPLPVLRGPVLDSSLGLAEAAAQGLGVALLPERLFAGWVADGRLAAAHQAGIATGHYWLCRWHSRPVTPALEAFKAWLLEEVAADAWPAQ